MAVMSPTETVAVVGLVRMAQKVTEQGEAQEHMESQ